MEETLGFRSVSFKISPTPGNGWEVLLVGELAGGRRGDDDLLISMAACPLVLEKITSSAASEIHVPTDVVESDPIRLTQQRGANGWQAAELAMQLRWRPDASTRGQGQENAFQAPCLILPDMLPRVAEATSSVGLAPPRQLARLFFEDELPPFLKAGGVALTDRRGKATPEFLQAIVFPATEGAPDFNDLVVTSAAVPADPDRLTQSYEYLQPLRREVAEILGPDMAVRPVVCLTNSANVFPVAGAYCPIAPADAGAERMNVGKPVTVIRLLAQAWLSGGIRLWGQNASDLSLAIGGALGLRWLREAGHENHLNSMLADMARRVKEAEATGDWRHANVVRAIELSLFHGLANVELQKALRNLIRASWGSFVPQENLINLFRHHRVAVPHVFA